MSALTANVAVAGAVLLAGVGLVLALLGLVAYRRIGHARLLWVALAFLGFAGKGVYLAVQAYEARGAIAEAGLGALLPTVILVDLAIVLALYLAAWTR